MESDTKPKNNAKDVIMSILAGIGIAVGVFLLGTVIIGALGLFLVGLLMPSCWESCPLMVLTLSPLCGGIIAIVAGINGGRKINKNIKDEGVSVDYSSGNALEKFIQKINSLKLEKSSEEYLKHGMVLSEKFEFDDAILEFVKVIKVSTPEDSTYQAAKKQLKEMGFSESDIKHISQ